ncbi:MAG: 50S ribosomal protein L28 [Anaerolineaceae bacterium]|nr:MAG: 50S ribosomal protein L28 [Anaerolineaceae bacterium]
MAGRRKVSGVKPQFGNNRSHSMKATRRKWKPNFQNKRFYIAEADQWVRLKVTAKEIKTIDKIGVEEFLKRQGRTVNSVL